ncbi:SPARC-like protein 1 [Syngnathoides biaculeatus]|uniref:SPARC-like protein 1 n=1 Tax=Syngnathoides biaculeatus TaxID=300417 RepID=UPI002ADD3F2E|nr:SPARC-like protein 1 [Syngnathoides biaculeatus]
MRTFIVFICLLAGAFPLSVENNRHGKYRTPHKAKEKDMVTEEANKVAVLPTLVTVEASSQEQEEGEASVEDNTNAKKKTSKLVTTKAKSEVVLLSEKELNDLLQKETTEEEEAEMNDDGNTGADEEEFRQIAEVQQKKLEMKQEELVQNKSIGDTEMLMNENKDSEVEMKLKEYEQESIGDENGALLEESEGSTESKILSSLDYAGDSAIVPPLRFMLAKVQALRDDLKPVSASDNKDGEVINHDVMQNTEGAEYHRAANQDHIQDNKAKDAATKLAEKDEEKAKVESGTNASGKMRRPKKNQSARNHLQHTEEKEDEQEQNQEGPQEMEGGLDKAKRRRAGQWGPLVGVNPVQIRAKVDLYPNARPSPPAEAPPDPCDDFHCKRGKMCKLDEDNKPNCVCQEPSECPSSLNDFEHVCGTDNKTYITSCELFATKCNLEGTKRGHKLHLDYTGPCKLIPPCVDTELVQFPLRMRDWLKNVLLQLYEHDSESPGFLTSKQRFRVKKIFESERRLRAGNHSAELLAQDFEKNYNMYIYPVHWQFAQLDQNPSDRVLSHSELAPLRVPLVPMEHCTSRFFHECDADKDKQVSLTEWTSCFSIKDNDIDVNLLF